MALFLALLCGCGASQTSSVLLPPVPAPAPEATSAVQEQQVIEVIHKERSVAASSTFYVIRFVPSNSLYLFAVSDRDSCSITPILAPGGYNSTSPYDYNDWNKAGLSTNAGTLELLNT